MDKKQNELHPHCLIYLEHVDALRESRFLKFISSNPKITFSIGYKRGIGVNFRENWPAEEDIKSFMVDFCQILLTDKQPANFLHICNLLEEQIKDERVKESVRSYRKSFNDALNRSNLIGIRENEKDIKPKYILTEWIMGYYRHDDEEYRERIKRWERLGGGIYKFMFIKTIIDLLNPIFEIA